MARREGDRSRSSPFGHGLSYTTFAYEGISLSAAAIGPNDELDVSVTIRNTGTRAGREVVQLYVHEQSPRGPRPIRELKAFAKVSLEPGEATLVRYTLEPATWRYSTPMPADGSSTKVTSTSSSAHRRGTCRSRRRSSSPDPARPPRLDRESTFQEWLEHPVGRPLVDAILHRPDVVALGNTAEFPLWKLAVMGIVSEDGIDDLVATASALASEALVAQVVRTPRDDE